MSEESYNVTFEEAVEFGKPVEIIHEDLNLETSIVPARTKRVREISTKLENYFVMTTIGNQEQI